MVALTCLRTKSDGEAAKTANASIFVQDPIFYEVVHLFLRIKKMTVFRTKTRKKNTVKLCTVELERKNKIDCFSKIGKLYSQAKISNKYQKFIRSYKGFWTSEIVPFL